MLAHPLVIGEIACGLFPRRSETLTLLSNLLSAPLLGQAEALGFIERHALAGKGIDFVDIQLLGSARVAGARLWSRDRRLAAAAAALGIAAHTARSTGPRPASTPEFAGAGTVKLPPAPGSPG